MKTLPSIMVVGDIEKSRRLETSIVKALEEVGYTLTDFHRLWDPKKPMIKIRYYDKYEPTWNYTHHTVEIPLTEEEYENYAHAGIDKIVRTLKEHAENTKKELYNRAYSTIKDK